MKKGKIMATRNDITGDELISKMNSQAFRDNFDRIFGVKKKERYVPPPLPNLDNKQEKSDELEL